jgi:hypothetical protein
MTNQGKPEQNIKNLDLWFYKSLPWPIEIDGSKIFFIALSFYRNIVRQNVSCDMGLRMIILTTTVAAA